MLVKVADMVSRARKTHGPTTKRVAANVRRLRQKQGMSARELSQRTSELGHEIPTEGIQKIEAAADGRPGARRIDVDELTVLSVALGVGPGTLLLPDDIREDTEVTGAGRVSGLAAWEWYRLQRPVELSEDHGEAVRQLWLFRAMAMPAGLAPIPDDYQQAYLRQMHDEIAAKTSRREEDQGGPD